MAKHVFMTGASGFLGRNLLNRLIEDYPRDRFSLLVRSAAAERFLRDRFSWVDPDKLVYVRGDTCLPNLGMSPRRLAEVLRNSHDFYHLAASTSFDSRKASEVRLCNVDGTGNVIDAVRGTDLHRFHYVSTAYICGTTSGVIQEDVMPKRNGFKNVYEETKYDAEKMVRESGLPYTIFRPSVLIGNSRTGDCDGETRMAYGYLLSLYYSAIHSPKIRGEANFSSYWKRMEGRESAAHLEIPCRLVGSLAARKNLLAVDDCVEMISRIVKTDRTHHKTYNLVNPAYVSAQDALDSISHALRIRGLVLAGEMHRDSLENIVEKRAYKLTKPFWPYALSEDPHWSTENTVSGTDGYEPDDVSKRPHFYMFEFAKKRLVKSA